MKDPGADSMPRRRGLLSRSAFHVLLIGRELQMPAEDMASILDHVTEV